MQFKNKITVLFLFYFLFFSGTAFARTITRTRVDDNTQRIHIVASSWADMIDPIADCGGSPGSWGFITYRNSDGTQGPTTNQIYTKTQLDITEDITLTNGVYENGIIFGASATNWNDLYNNTSCNTVGEKPFSYAGNGNGIFGTTTIPWTLSTSSSSCIFASGTLCYIVMTTSTDAMLGNFLQLGYMFLVAILFVSVAWIIIKIIK